MIYVDVHAHLDMIENLDVAIHNAEEAGVKFIIANGVDPESNRKVLEYSKNYDVVKPAFGIYPNDSLKMSFHELKEEYMFIRQNNPIAIGECGLDYKEENVDLKKMKTNFANHIEIAKNLNIPIIVHSRKAEQDCITMLEESGHKKIVMHCFSGKKKLVQKIVNNGWSLSIPACVVRSKQFQEMVAITPLKQLLTETDAPFLSPDKDRKSIPSDVVFGVEEISKIKGLTLEETSSHIFMNFQKLFL